MKNSLFSLTNQLANEGRIGMYSYRILIDTRSATLAQNYAVRMFAANTMRFTILMKIKTLRNLDNTPPDLLIVCTPRSNYVSITTFSCFPLGISGHRSFGPMVFFPIGSIEFIHPTRLTRQTRM